MNIREPDHLNLLCDIGELTSIVTGDSDIETFLDKTVALVAKHLKANVCSIYLYDALSGDLVLRATRGLNPQAVNRIRMKSGEGLIGQCFSQDRILRVGNAPITPGFKFFDNAGEEPFSSFLCVPIRRGVAKIGVLAVQHRKMDHFTLFDERALKTAVTQLAGAIENARLLMALSQDREIQPVMGTPQGIPSFIKGKSNGTGSAYGSIRPSRLNKKALLFEPDSSGAEYSAADFKKALNKTIDDLKALQDNFAASLPESASLIFTAHFMMLKDKNFTGRMTAMVEKGLPPVEAIQTMAGKYIDIFSQSPHAYLREKAVDVEDLGIRLLSNLKDSPKFSSKGNIAVVRDIYPSDILKLSADGIRGIVLVGGGMTSHVAILARSLNIPLIIADDPVLLDLPGETMLLLDTGQGNIFINPDEETLALFQASTEAETRPGDMAETTHTRDKERIRLLANINLLSEIRLAKELKAEGVGLYRTEFPFLIRTSFPSEDEQYIIYKRLFQQVGEDRVTTIRTLDAGGEKSLSHAGFANEANPLLGLRSIRFTLRYKEIFQTQIRAILRAAYGSTGARLMFPLISSIDEFTEARQIVAECAADLDSEGIAHEPDVAVGMMIELPSVLPIIDEFAQIADFFAIGTNDFVQYMLGADRSNELVAEHYIPCHPAVCRGIAAIAKAGRKHGIDVSVCGEMAHDPDFIPFLLGTGISTLSVDPKFLPRVQQSIAKITMDQCRSYANDLLSRTRVEEALKVIENRPF
ncbi:MAG: phosphoenolpyruvate--protein phosphotransferase [Desulfobacter sp.]|nr:MAG: phosphoenolpyruvate--protein phosphotransferase [Desulfobacter sp.]